MPDDLASLGAWAQLPGDAKFSLAVSKDGKHVDSIPIFTSKPLCVLGRHSQLADVVLDHASLSRQHCVLVHGPDGCIYLTDLKSTHGTLLNGQRMPPNEKIPIDEGDTFMVGGSTRSYRVVAAAAEQDSASASNRQPVEKESRVVDTKQSIDSTSSSTVSKQNVPESREEARRKREAEIAAMVASFSAPLPSKPTPAAAAASNRGDDEEDDDGGPPLPMRRSIDNDNDEGGAFASRPVAASASGRGQRAAAKPSISFGASIKPVVVRPRHADEVIGSSAAASSSSAGAASDSGLTASSTVERGAQNGTIGSSSNNSSSAADVNGEQPFDNDDDNEGEEDDNDNDGMDEMAAMNLPSGFGSRKALVAASKASRSSAAAKASADDDGDDAAAAAASAGREGIDAAFRRVAADDYDDDHDDEEDNEEEEEVDDAARRLGLPISHEVVLTAHSKTVTAVSIDPGGGRLATGGADYMLRLYDFGGMDRSHKPFRELMPVEGQPIHAIAFSPNGDRFIVATGHAKARVFDREGAPIVTTIKGDPYITDMVNTKGHTAGLTGCAWHPTNRENVMTSSHDGSIRFWDLAHGKAVFNELCCGDVIKLRSTHKQRVAVTASTLSPDGRFIVGAGDDGSLQLFNVRGAGHKYVRADAAVTSAHAPGDTTAVVLSADGLHLASRNAADSTVKIWDVRKLSGKDGHLGIIRGIDTSSPSANVAWSPDGRALLVGTAVRKGAGDGQLRAFSLTEVEALGTDGIDGAFAASYTASLAKGASVVALAWHPKINQIAAGCGDGAMRLLYDPSLSTKGALLSTARAPKARDLHSDVTVRINPHALDIIAPNAPSLFRDERLPKKRKFMEIQREQLNDPRKKPGLPVDEPAFLHKGKKTFTENFMAQYGVSGDWRAQDPAEALRAYADKAAEQAAKGQSWAARVYAATQPQPVLAATTIEQQVAEEKEEAQRLLGIANAAGAQPQGQ